MRIGFIVECSQEGPEESVVKAVMATFRPKDDFLVSPMVDKGKLLEGAPGETRRLLGGDCAKVFVLWDWHPLEAHWSGKVKKRWKPGVCRVEAHELRDKLEAADVKSGRIVLICVAQELEAWALADHQAIDRPLPKTGWFCSARCPGKGPPVWARYRSYANEIRRNQNREDDMITWEQ